MSLNLFCVEVDLWQTPTHITLMCLSDSEGKGRGKYDGGWKGVLFRYKIWVRSHTNGVWKDPEDLKFEQERVNRHIKELDKAARKYKKLIFGLI